MPSESQSVHAAPRRIFREAHRQDETAIVAILHEASLSAPAPVSGASSNPANSRFVVCQLAEEIVAVLHWRDLAGEADILDLATAVQHRRKGHARFLLASFLDHLRRNSSNAVYLEVRESNAPALALYRSFGFTVSGRRPNYYRSPDEAALLLHLELSVTDAK